MTFALAMQHLTNHRTWKNSIRALGRYLDAIGYHGLYKYLVSVRNYHLQPYMFFEKNIEFLASLESFPGGGLPHWNLAKCLTARRACRVSGLTSEERELAGSLSDIGLLKRSPGDQNTLIPGELQLLSVGNRYLLVDGALFFEMGRIHEIYLGPDTLLLLYYLGFLPGGGRGRKALDLCSGSGIVGLSLTGFAGEVTVTDISPAALSLIAVNAALNNAEKEISVREENMTDTLDSAETFDWIVCNPPFVPFPEGFDGPIYAAGTGADGLDYLRLLIEKTPSKLNPDGEGLFISDLPGDDFEPYFFGELRGQARSRELQLDAYVDGRVPGDAQIPSLAAFLGQMYPAQPLEMIRGKVEALIKRNLRARYYYLTTLRLRKSGVPGLRVFNRYGKKI
jgi:hypothetical protein